MNDVPLVTVITPAFNVGKYLSETISSVLSQTFKNFEYIIIDDGSTDESLKVIEKFATKDHRIIALHQDNMGAGEARNAGLKRARGEYIAFIDGDDVWSSRFLETMLEVLQNLNQNYAGIFCWSQRIDEEGMVTPQTYRPREGDYDFFNMFERICAPCNGSALLLRRKCFDVAGQFLSMRTGQDAEMWLRISSVGDNLFKSVPILLVKYRRRSGSLTDLKKTVQMPMFIDAMKYNLNKYLPLVNKQDRWRIYKSYADYIDSVSLAYSAYSMGLYRKAFISMPKKIMLQSTGLTLLLKSISGNHILRALSYLSINRRYKKISSAIAHWLCRLKNPLPQVSLVATPKVSLCITCHGRLHHLEQTLIKNLENNQSYPAAEFVLLNYGFDLELDRWSRSKLMTWIDKGVLTYYRTDHYDYFRPAHAKNIAHILATGAILCNLDADNFTGRNFADYLAAKFTANFKIILSPDEIDKSGITGRIALLKQYFVAAGGYSEDFEGYGHEDLDLKHRMLALGLQRVVCGEEYLAALYHSDEERGHHTNLNSKNVKFSEKHNSKKSKWNISKGKLIANQGRDWGQAMVYKNFSNVPIQISRSQQC